MNSRFARTGFTSPLGKLDASIKEFRIPSEVKDRLEQLAAEQGLNLSEYMRDMAMVRVYGPDMLAKVHRERYIAVAGMSRESTEVEK